MARNPWKKLLANVKLSGTYGCFGGSGRNPKNRDGKKKRGSQSTKTHEILVGWEDLKNQFEDQDGKCFWMGLPLDPHWVFISHFVFAPSVDRVFNEGEYTRDNIVITSRFANIGRRNTDPETFAKMMEAIAKKGIMPPTKKMIEELRNRSSLALTTPAATL